jgi:hypothetical protein
MRLIICLCILLLAACSNTKSPHPELVDLEKRLEDAKARASEISRGKRACYKVYPTAVSAIENRKRGMSQDELLAVLPSRVELENYPTSRDAEKRLGLAMLDIAEQVYNYTNLDPQAYSAFSAELCQRKLFNLEVPSSFESAYPQLLECNSLPQPKQRINCGMAVAGSKIEKPNNSSKRDAVTGAPS